MENVLCRFAVGDPGGPRSSSYRVWAAKNYPDVYIASRALGSMIKTTLHAPRSDLGFERNEGHTKLPVPQGPANYDGSPLHVMSKWPGLEVEPGALLQFMLAFPSSGLRVFDEPKSRDVAWISAPPLGSQVLVLVYILTANVIVPADHAVLGETVLCDGRRAVVAYGEIPEFPPSTTVPQLEALAQNGLPASLDLVPGIRVALHSEFKDATHPGYAGLIIEVAADALEAFRK